MRRRLFLYGNSFLSLSLTRSPLSVSALIAAVPLPFRRRSDSRRTSVFEEISMKNRGAEQFSRTVISHKWTFLLCLSSFCGVVIPLLMWNTSTSDRTHQRLLCSHVPIQSEKHLADRCTQ
ncbi:hypothetical protein ACS0TY_014795 [Phlomoides rotata]